MTGEQSDINQQKSELEAISVITVKDLKDTYINKTDEGIIKVADNTPPDLKEIVSGYANNLKIEADNESFTK